MQLAVEVDQRQQVAAQTVHRRAVDLLDAALGLLAFQADQLQQADLRDGIAVAAAGDGQGRDDGQGQGDLHLHRGAAPGPALDVDRAADLLDVGPHHVHADAAAGELRHLVGRREAGQEDQVDQLALVQAVGLLGRDQLGLDGLVADALRVDPPAVVGDLDDDLAPLVEGVQRRAGPRRGLPRASRSAGGSMP